MVVPGDVVWRLQQGSRTLRCELRDESRVGAGWDVQALEEGWPLFTQRCPDEPSARELADALRRDFLRDGWTEPRSN